MRQIILIFLAVFTFYPLSAQGATFGLSANGRLDQTALAKAYKESDWDKVTEVLESYLRRKGDNKVELEERIFAFKYLGTIYAADSLTHTKSESYYNRLLDLSPSVEIFDLYASKKINDFFESVKRDHERSRNYANKFDTYGREQKSPADQGAPKDSMPAMVSKQPIPQPIPARQETRIKDKSSSAWIWWTVGIAAAAGAGATAYYMTNSETKVVTRDLDDPVPSKP
jgi:hypothetical protein